MEASWYNRLTLISPTSDDTLTILSHFSALLSLKLPTRILFVRKPSRNYLLSSLRKRNTAQHSTAWYSIAQHSRAQHSAAHHSTAQQSTAQHSTANPHKQQTKYSRFKKAELARASMWSSICTARCVLKTNEEIKICPADKCFQPFTKQLSWCDVACTLIFLSVLLLHPCMQRPAYFRGPRSSWHLQVASLHRKPWVSLPASSLIRIVFNSSL